MIKCRKLIIGNLILFLYVSASYGQCRGQVTHTTGTKSLEGVNVSVSSWSFVNSNEVYCTSTFPYGIGTTPFGGNGSFTFSFFPAINSATLNFSGLGNVTGHAEEIKLYKNGVHYPVTTVGTLNNCDSLAMLTPAGNIRACTGCFLAGWNGTILNGPITSLTVLDTLIAGNPGGAIFSLFICGNSVAIAEQNIYNNAYLFFPNPFTGETCLDVKGLKPSSVTVIDFKGQVVKKMDVKESSERILLTKNELEAGLYYYILKSGDKVLGRGRLVAE